MAKPKDGTLAALWEVSDRERREFFEHIQNRSTGTPTPKTQPLLTITGTPVIGIPNSSVFIDCEESLDGGIVSGIPISGTPNTEQVTLNQAFYELRRDISCVPGESACVPGEGAPELGIPDSLNSSQGSHTHELGTPLPGVPAPTCIGASLSPARKIRRAVQVQDGHSLGEHLVLTTLWKDPAAVPAGPSTKRITIGYRTLSEKCRLTVNNCKANLRSLQQKLAIKAIVAPSNSHATTYLVYDFAEIIRRREVAGMTHVIRSKGCIFVHPETGQPVTGTPVSGTQTVPGSGIPTDHSGIPGTDRTGIPDPGPPIRNKNLHTKTTLKEPSSSLHVIPAAAAQLGLTLDDDAVRKLVRRCHEADQVATEDEISHFLAIKIRQLQRSKTVSNMVGLLIESVPVFFGPPASELTRYRESKVAEAREPADRDERLVAEARKILDDPDASDSDKNIARSWLPNAAGEGNSS